MPKDNVVGHVGLYPNAFQRSTAVNQSNYTDPRVPRGNPSRTRSPHARWDLLPGVFMVNASQLTLAKLDCVRARLPGRGKGSTEWRVVGVYCGPGDTINRR